MLLKGFLSRRRTSAELKAISHELVTLWDLFKLTTGNDKLARFDVTISRLDRVELLRYPDLFVNEGYVLNVQLGPPTAPIDLPGAEQLPPTM